MYALRAHINHPFFETFYEELKKLSKKLLNFFIFLIKSFLKWFTNACPKCTH